MTTMDDADVRQWARRALTSFDRADEQLLIARKWSWLDRVFPGSYASARKYRCLDAATHALEGARRAEEHLAKGGVRAATFVPPIDVPASQRMRDSAFQVWGHAAETHRLIEDTRRRIVAARPAWEVLAAGSE